MKKLVVLLLLLGVAGSEGATVNQWNSTNTTTNWFDEFNWTMGVPTANSDVILYQSSGVAPGPVLLNGQSAVAFDVLIASNNTTPMVPQTLTINPGATLAVSSYIYVGGNGNTKRWGDFIVNGGTISSGTLSVGRSSSTGTGDQRGWLHMIDGTINVSGLFAIAEYQNASGFAYLYGGTINAGSFTMLGHGGTGTVLLDIKNNGKLIINGDVTGTIAGYVANNWITANGTQRALYDYNITTPGKTTVFVPEPTTLCLLGIGVLSLVRRK